MKISGIIWLETVLEKLEHKHNVRREEVRETLEQSPRFRFVEKGFRRDEHVYAALGPTEAGRYLIVFFVYRKDQRIIILSARDMTDGERRRYERK